VRLFSFPAGAMVASHAVAGDRPARDSPQGQAASGDPKFALGLQHRVFSLGQFIGHGTQGAFAGAIHVNLMLTAFGLDDDPDLFHAWRYAKESKTGHCYFQTRGWWRWIASKVAMQARNIQAISRSAAWVAADEIDGGPSLSCERFFTVCQMRRRCALPTRAIESRTVSSPNPVARVSRTGVSAFSYGFSVSKQKKFPYRLFRFAFAFANIVFRAQRRADLWLRARHGQSVSLRP
jgi:hypothetical protein